MPGDRLKVGNAGKEIEIEAGVANAAAAADRDPTSHYHTVAALRRRRIWILALSDRSPYRRHEMIFCSFAVSNKTGARFADFDTGTSKIVLQPLVVLGETTQLEFRRGNLVWAVHAEQVGWRGRRTRGVGLLVRELCSG